MIPSGPHLEDFSCSLPQVLRESGRRGRLVQGIPGKGGVREVQGDGGLGSYFKQDEDLDPRRPLLTIVRHTPLEAVPEFKQGLEEGHLPRPSRPDGMVCGEFKASPAVCAGCVSVQSV